MKLNSIGLGVLMLGLIVVVYAMFFMEVSINGEYVNADLLNQRLLLVIFGSIAILLGGLILLATKLTGRNLETVGGGAIAAWQRSSRRAVDALRNYGTSKAIRTGAFVIGVIGLVLLGRFLFSPVEEVSSVQGWVGLLLLGAGIYLNRDALRPKGSGVQRERKSLRRHLIAVAIMLLVGVVLVLGPLFFMEGGVGVQLFGFWVFLLGVLYLMGASVWVWWFNRSSESERWPES